MQKPLSLPRFEQISISDWTILKYPAAQRILRNLTKFDLLPYGFSEPEVLDAEVEARKLQVDALHHQAPENHPIGLGKKRLHLTTSPGTFIKQCPGTNNMLCCHYYIVNMVANCPYDCSYCFLQTYLNQPMVTLYVNEDDIFEQVRKLCASPPVSAFRVGTGEISDSLALDPITEFSAGLAKATAGFENVRLELKTKSANIEHLASIEDKSHVIIAWSLNPTAICQTEEHGAPGVEKRLDAARRAVELGFDVAFHFDPMVAFSGWKEGYADIAEKMLAAVPHERIQWISIGGLRYQPQLRPITLKRHPDTSIFFDESVAGEDGKVRYLRPLRVKMFQFLNSHIKKLAPDVYTYLCMESKPVWERALGRMPDRGF